ncbi:MAG: hypothetical protein RR318_01320 [Alistipes sp.]
MKKLLKFMLAAVLVSTAAISCSDDDPVTDNTNPGEGVNPPVEQVLESKAKTALGVSITAKTSAEGFTFTTEMGIDAPTYRLDVMPYTLYLNQFFEARKTNKNMTEEEFLTTLLFATGGSAGYIMNAPFDGDWFKSKFKQAAYVPGIDYIILTAGALMADGTQVGEFNTLIVPMHKPEIVGDPKVDVLLKSGYTGVEFAFTMNKDCSGFYQLILPTDHVDEFFTEFGDKADAMLREMICCYMKEPMREDWPLDFRDFGLKVQPGHRVTSLAIGLDINGNLAKTYSRKDVALKVEALPAAEYTCTIKNVSAISVITEWDTDPNSNGVTRAAYHRVLQEAMFSDPDDEKWLFELADGGYGHNKLSPRLDVEWDLQPETDYVLISTARNWATNFTPLQVQHFTTKKLVTDKPAESKAQITCELIKPSKTSITVKYNIPDGTTCYFERVVEKGYIDEDSGVSITDDNLTDAQILDVMLTSTSFSNSAAYTADDNWAWTGLEPAREYYYFLVGEDMNGYMGPLTRKKFETKNNIGGPNPKVEITGAVSKQSDGTYIWDVTFTINDDVTKQLTAVIEDTTPDGTKPEDMVNTWIDKLVGPVGEQGAGMPSVNTTWAHPAVTKYSREVALSLPYGADDVQGSLAYLVFKPEMIVSSMLSVRPLQMDMHRGPKTDMSKYKKVNKL